jgi:Nitroreductase family
MENYKFFDAPVGLIFVMDRMMQIGQYVDLGMYMQNIMLLAESQGIQTVQKQTHVFRSVYITTMILFMF